MNIAFLSPCLSRNAGGIFEIERSLALAINGFAGTRVVAYGATDSALSLDRPLWGDIELRTAPSLGPTWFGYAPGLIRPFLENEADVTHLHSLWTYPSVLVDRWSRRTGRAYVTTINGMLEPWALRTSAWKKRIARWLYEERSLGRAACIHVNTEMELRSARAFGLRNPICVIPNGVDLPDLAAEVDLASVEVPSGAKLLLYLGRLHPKKNLKSVITAFAQESAASPDWVFGIAGWDQNDHEQDLRTHVAELGLAERVLFLGPAFARRKEALFRRASGFVLASHSEGFPMAVLEAWSFALPALITPECNLSVGFETGAAIKVEVESQSIRHGLDQLFRLTDRERREIGMTARRLVEAQFNWKAAAKDLLEVYEWVVGGSATPACVVRH